jgi:predicted nucleic acid-binding protein
MIFVDTSIWVEALRRGESAEARHLSVLLDDGTVALAVPVRIELLAGCSTRDRAALRRTLSALPVFHPEGSTWRLVESWLDLASAAGERFGFADLLIGAIAAEQEGELWSRNADFQRMAQVGLVRLHAA